MTYVGHSLVGLSIGVFALPRNRSKLFVLAYAAAFIFLANIPDLDFSFWGHARYHISHSLFVTLALIAFVFLVLWLTRTLNTRQRLKIFLAGSLAWLSHLLLDSFYNHGHGIAIFWPFSDAHLALPMPWFSILKPPPPPLTGQAIGVFAIELLFYVPILLICILIKRKLDQRKEKRISCLSE